MLKRILTIVSVLLAAGIAITACTGQNEVELTLIAENMMLSTEVADARATGTWAADRLAATSVAMQTDVYRAQQQQDDMQSTLVARGTPIEYVSANMPAPLTPYPTRTPLPDNSGNNPTTGNMDTARAPVVSAQVTPGVGGQPVTNPNSPLSNAVMTTSVDANGCAVGAATQFTPQTQEIYVVAVASSISRGQQYTSRWMYNGQEMIAHQWTADYSVDSPECIWFFIDQTEVTFGAGNWSVTLEVDGQVAAGPIPFVISGDASNTSAVETDSANPETAVVSSAQSSTNAGFSNLVMATGVGSNGCATNTTSQFSSSAAELYVVATANNIPAGTRIIASWQLNGQEIASYDWTPDYNITQECIWFYVDQTAFPFTAGSWSVSLTAEGLGVGGQVSFTITG